MKRIFSIGMWFFKAKVKQSKWKIKPEKYSKNFNPFSPLEFTHKEPLQIRRRFYFIDEKDTWLGGKACRIFKVTLRIWWEHEDSRKPFKELFRGLVSYPNLDWSKDKAWKQSWVVENTWRIRPTNFNLFFLSG